MRCAVVRGDAWPVLLSLCNTEKALNAWHRRGTQKTGNTYNQSKRPSTDTTHRPSTKHYRKGSPGFNTHNTNQHSSRARLHTATTRHHHPHPTGKSTDPLSQRSPLRSACVLSRITPQTPPASAGTRSSPPPPPGGPIIRSGRWTAQGARPTSEEGKGGRRGGDER